MPNAIKYSTSTQTLALKKGNFFIGTGDVGKGPTSTTGYYNGITPPNGGYTIYLNKESNGPSIYTVTTDAQLISLTNSIAGASYTTVNECLDYFAGQTDKIIFNRDYEPIVTDGLVLNLDAGFTPSYPRSGTSWFDVGGSNNGTLTNGPAFNSANSGSIVFDGVDDFISISNSSLLTFGTNPFSIGFWIYPIHTTTGFPYRTILSNYLGYNSDYQTYFYLGIFNNNEISFLDSSGNFFMSSFILSTNIWTYVTFTRNGSVNSSFKNGVFENSTSKTSNFNGVRSVKIGGGVSDVLSIQGNLSNMSIYNRALTASEVLQNYNATKSRFGL